MWEAISSVLTSSSAWMVLLFLGVFVFVVVILVRCGFLSIHTHGVHIGAGAREREIIRQQAAWVHGYIKGLEVDILKMCKDNPEYDPYRTKYVLEVMYDDVVEWITYNHITTDPDYVAIKQDGIKAHLKCLDINPDFLTPKFFGRVDGWVVEVIEHLVKIKDVYR